MNKFRGLVKSHPIAVSLLSMGLLGTILCGGRLLRAQAVAGTSVAPAEDALIADFRRVEVASVSDALEQLTGKRMYMSHRMHPILTTKFAGFA
jgi:chemotaxis protein CheY-P-specific phosphatase CheC